MFGNMAQDLGRHALMAGAGAFKNTVTPDFVTKLVTKGVNAATNAIARRFGGSGGGARRGRGFYIGRRMQRRGRGYYRGRRMQRRHR